MTFKPQRSSTRLAWTLIVLILNAVILLAGCDFLESTHELSSTYVVESYQIAGEPLRHARVMESRSAEVKYEAGEAGVTGARVELELLTAEDSVQHRYPYRAHPDRAGIYVPAPPGGTIRPLRRYRLRVRLPESDSVLTATTTIPDTFSVAATNPDTVTYGETEQFGIRVRESHYPDRPAIYLLNTTITREQRTRSMLTPAGKELVEGTESLAGDSPYTLGSLSGNEWPMRSAEQYPHHGDGSLTVTYPWENFVYYGPNTVHVHTVCDNLHRYFKADKAQVGGAPGEIPNVTDDVEGGAGLFAGIARQTYVVHVAP